jgi:hypothetical protein
MKITITDKPNSVRLDYNDIAAPTIFSRNRTIRKNAVREARMITDGESEFVEVIFTNDEKEQFSYDLFEGFESNFELYEYLDSLI